MLTSKQKQQLKAMAHALHPIVQVGDAGLSEAVLAELNRALYDHELVKVRIPALERDARQHMAQAVAENSMAELVNLIGRVVILYRGGGKKQITLEPVKAAVTRAPAAKRTTARKTSPASTSRSRRRA